MKLTYKAITREGKTLRGIIEAKDIREAATYLRSHEMLPITISQKTEIDLLKYIPFINKTGNKELVFFTGQLASMLMSGITLIQALSILKAQIKNPTFAAIINTVVVDIEEGKSFSEALEAYPKIFSPIYLSLVRAGEASGLMDKILTRLAQNLEKQQQLRSTIQSALMYPMIVIIGMVAVVIVMMFFVIPQLAFLYESLDAELPLPTLIIVSISTFFLSYWPVAIILFVTLGIGIRKWNHTAGGKLVIDTYILKLPVFGQLIRESILTEITRTLSLLVGSGTLVVKALSQTADVAGNVLYKNAMKDISRGVEKGLAVGEVMSHYPLFPPILVQMAKIGEETGKLDESLNRVSEYFEREVETMTKNLTTALEPIILIVLGVGVAFLIISIITPIYTLIQKF